MLLIKASNNSSDVKLCSSLVNQVKDLQVESTLIDAVLVEECHEMILDNLIGDIGPDQLMKMMNLLQFVGDLYQADVINKDFISTCLYLLLAEENDNAADCLSFLLTIIGAKLEAEDHTMLDKYFDMFKAETEAHTNRWPSTA